MRVCLCLKPMKSLIESIVKSLVDNPESVEVSQTEGEETTIIEVKVLKSDLGKIIGKQGKMAQSLRQIVSSLAGKMRRKAVLEIIE